MIRLRLSFIALACVPLGLLAGATASPWPASLGDRAAVAFAVVSAGLAVSVALETRRQMQRLRGELAALAADTADASVSGEIRLRDDDPFQQIQRARATLRAVTQREQERARAVVQRQKAQLVHLQRVEEADALLENHRPEETIQRLEQVPPDLGKISQRARELRLAALLELGDERRLESEVRRGDLRGLPQRVLRMLAKRLEDSERVDLALECMTALIQLAPESAALLHERHRLVQLKASLDSEHIPMDVIRRSLGGRFTRVRFHATGGMSLILKAVLKDTGRQVAVKLVPPALSQSVELRRRLDREVRVLLKLQHPNVVTVLGGIEGELVGYYMELLEGEDLAVVLRQRRPRLTVAEAAQIMVQVVEGLHFCHAEGVIHRDVKPANFMCLHDGTVKLVDFGVAAIADGTLMTMSGGQIGTPSYMAPEQVRPNIGDVGEHSDVYALGVMMFEMLVGTRPFSDRQVLFEKLSAEPPRLRERLPDLPSDVATVVERCLIRLPEQRTVTCDEILQVFRRYLDTNVSLRACEITAAPGVWWNERKDEGP